MFLGYAAPELLRLHRSTGGAPLTEKVDCWSVGSTAFDTFFGQVLCKSDIESLEAVNESVTVDWPGEGLLVIHLGVQKKRKWKLDTKSSLVAELLAGLLAADPNERFSANYALELINRQLNMLYECFLTQQNII